MRSWTAFGLFAVLTLGLGALAAGTAGGVDQVVLLDGPRGAWLADVRGDASLVIVEERDGWRHVRLEGWMPAGTAGRDPAGGSTARPAAAPPAAIEVPAPPSAPAEARGAGAATVTGLLLPTPGMQPATPGGNLVVVLVHDLDKLDAEHAAEGDRCRTTIVALDEKIAAQTDLVNKALNSTNNLTEATSRYDRAKADLARARRERAEGLETCRVQADLLLAKYAVARTLSDPSGRFGFHEIPPGRYRVVAGEHSAAGARAWSIDCPVTGPGEQVVDPRTGVAGPDPYWGLR